MSMSSKIALGRGDLISNGKVVAMTFGDQVVIIDMPIVKDAYLRHEVEEYSLQSGFPSLEIARYPISQKLLLDLTLEARTGKFISGIEKGFVQRLLTEDIDILQLARLIREKQEGRKI